MENLFRKCLFFSLFFLQYPVYCQDLLWEKSYGGRHADILADVEPTADYGFILGGSSLSKKTGIKKQNGSGDLDYLIWKMDESGSTEWQKSFGGSGSDLLKVIHNTADGGFILGGVSNSPVDFDKKEACRGGNDYWVIKLDAKGAEMWQHVYGGKGNEDLTSLIPTSDGGYLIGGSSSSSAEHNEQLKGRKKENSRGSLDYWIVKINADGIEEWQHTYGGKYADVLQSMITTRDGGYLLGGYSNSPSSQDKSLANLGAGNDFWILKLDARGTIEWQQVLGGSSEDQLQVVLQTRDGHYLVGGNSSSTTKSTKNGTDLWLVKLDLLGSALWERAYDIGKNDILRSLSEEENGDLIVGAYSPSGYNEANDKEGINDYVALKLSSTGEELWRKVNGSNGEDVLKKLIVTRDGGYLLVGTSNPEFNGYTPKKKAGLSSDLLPFNSSEQLAGLKKVQDALDSTVQEYSDKINNAVKDEVASLVQGVNDKIDSYNKSNFKVGMNGPVGDLLNPSNGGSGANNSADFENFGPKKGTKISRDKKVSYGGKDFWVIKLKDEEQPLKEKSTIEAYPNPTEVYTNVIIGFEYDSGTASVYDLGGRALQSFKIENRTVPVNLSSYPDGIYILFIKTNKGEGSVKIIKN